MVGAELLARLKRLTLALYAFGVAHAESSGIILADTKFEFGLTDDGELLLIDEMMTPDSSRYWPADQYAPGRAATELRQAVRPRLPRVDQVEQAAAGAVAARRTSSPARASKYLDAYRRLTGAELVTAS